MIYSFLSGVLRAVVSEHKQKIVGCMLSIVACCRHLLLTKYSSFEQKSAQLSGKKKEKKRIEHEMEWKRVCWDVLEYVGGQMLVKRGMGDKTKMLCNEKALHMGKSCRRGVDDL